MKFFAFLTRRLGFRPTPAQSVFVRVALDDEPIEALSAGDRELAAQLFGAGVTDVPPLARDTIVLVKGARTGGTYISAIYLLYRALFGAVTTLAPGELATSLVVGPDMRLARQALRYARGAVASDPDLEDRVGADTSDAFTVERDDGHRVAIEALPATRGGSALRGRSLLAVQLTEAAFFRAEDSGAVNDADILSAVGPRVMPGGKVILESTPWLESGVTFELFRDNHGDPKTALATHAPTRLMRTDERTLAMVEREERRDPDNAAVEFGAQFIGGGAGVFFDPLSITKSIDEDLVLGVRRPGIVGCGGDLGLVSDSSALAVVAHDANIITLADLLEERPKKGAPLKLSAVLASFAAKLRAHDASSFFADGHSREAAREHAEKEKIRIEDAPAGNEGKWRTHLALQQAMKEGRFRMPDHPRLAAQLRSVVARPKPGGGFTISSPRRAGGGHGDLVSALVLAVHAVDEGSRAGELARAARRTRPGGEAYRFGDRGRRGFL